MQFQCNICSKVYSTNFNRLKHVRKVHDDTMYLKKSNINCLKCKETFKHLKDLRTHLALIHSMEEQISILQFENFTEFKTWKRKEEVLTCCQYVAVRGAIRLANDRIKKEFICHRSGFVKRQVDSSKSTKRHCSYKLNATCPASIEAMMNADGSVCVKFHRSHLDHSKEMKYLTISREERAVIGAKLAEGCSFNEILTHVKSLSDTNELSARFCQLTRKDLYNIKNYFQLNNNYELDETNGQFKNVADKHVYVDKTFIERDIQKNHNLGSRIERHHIIERSEKNCVWNIKSYVVKMLKPSMCDCDVKCSICNICAHMFQCNCYEAHTNKNTICPHIHAIVRHLFDDENSLMRFYVNRNEITSTCTDEHQDKRADVSNVKNTTIFTNDQSVLNLTENNNDKSNVGDETADSSGNDIIVYSFELDCLAESTDPQISFLFDFL